MEPRALRVAVLLLSVGCGSVIQQKQMPGAAADFNFRRPQCQAAPASASDVAVEIRYLGSGGVYVRWGNDAVLLGPYFSRPGIVRARFGRVRFDEQRIAAGMASIDPARVHAVITGHAHFDHLGDVPVLLRDYVPHAVVYTNRSGVRMLAPYTHSSIAVEALADTRTVIPRKDGKPSRIRITPLPWGHAPQLCGADRAPCTYAKCEVATDWTTPWPERRLVSQCGGATFAYIVDLLDDEGRECFRIYYNDSASAADPVLPSQTGPAVDLAIVCMASYHFVEGYPERLIAALKPHHVLVSHYDDFFVNNSTGEWRFAPLMTNGRANRFLVRLSRAMTRASSLAVPPVNPVCGAATGQWTMPVPQWPLIFTP